MNRSDSNIDVRVEKAGGDGSPVRRIAVAVPGGCLLEVAPHDGTVVVRLSAAGIGVSLAIDGPHSDFVRAVNLLRLHLPRCRM